MTSEKKYAIIGQHTVECGASSRALDAALIPAHVSAEMLLCTTGLLLTQSVAPSPAAEVASGICCRNKTEVTTKR